jgi:hypothetical protein
MNKQRNTRDPETGNLIKGGMQGMRMVAASGKRSTMSAG